MTTRGEGGRTTCSTTTTFFAGLSTSSRIPIGSSTGYLNLPTDCLLSLYNLALPLTYLGGDICRAGARQVDTLFGVLDLDALLGVLLVLVAVLLIVPQWLSAPPSSGHQLPLGLSSSASKKSCSADPFSGVTSFTSLSKAPLPL